MLSSLTKTLLIGLLLASAGLPACAASVTLKTALDSAESSSAETNYGDLVADSIRASSGADIAFVSSTELRDTSIAPGDVDSQRVVGVLRAASDATDTVYILHLTGTQILKALNRSVSRSPNGYDGFLQVAGVQFTYKPASTEAVRVDQVLIGGKALLPDQTYTVATSRLLADGAVGYFEVWDKTAVTADTGVPISKALGDFVVGHSPIDYHVEGRIASK